MAERWIEGPPVILTRATLERLSDLNSREEDAAILLLAGRESDDGANLIITVKRQGAFHYFTRFRRSEISENPPGRFRWRKIHIAPWHYVSAIIFRNTNDCAMIALPAPL